MPISISLNSCTSPPTEIEPGKYASTARPLRKGNPSFLRRQSEKTGRYFSGLGNPGQAFIKSFEPQQRLKHILKYNIQVNEPGKSQACSLIIPLPKKFFLNNFTKSPAWFQEIIKNIVTYFFTLRLSFFTGIPKVIANINS